MKSVGAWLSIFSILALSSCATPCWERLKNTTYIYDIDVNHNACGKYKITGFNPFRVQWIQDLPLRSCNGFFAMSPGDQQKVKNCINDSIEECKK